MVPKRGALTSLQSVKFRYQAWLSDSSVPYFFCSHCCKTRMVWGQ